MFAALQTEIVDRCFSADAFFTAVGGGSTAPPAGTAATAIATAKGLMFVELYAVYEFTVVGIVRAAICAIKAKPTPISTIRLELLGMALHNEITAVSTCGPARTWKNRMELFLRTNSTDPLDVADDLFPGDGSHFRVQQLRTIWALFGISAEVVPEIRLLGRIEELVEMRNAVAHGRRTAVEVGRTFSIHDIQTRIADTRTICLYLNATMQAHVADPANLQR